MIDLKNLALRGKIVSIGILLPTVLLLVLFKMYSDEGKEKSLQSYADKARAICLTAEATRMEMEDKWKLNVFNQPQLREYAESGQHDKMLAMVPVFSSWQAAMRKADEGGYTFKVPKFSPRNPKNQPDEFEARVLKLLTEKNLDEYYEVDEQQNAVRYFRAVRLTETCMLCHGDPATSQELWGNDQGLDPTGAKMEGWQTGQIHGAFEVIQSLAVADQQLATSITNASKVVLIGLLLMGIFFAVFVVRIVSNSVIKPITRIIGDMSNGAANMLDAANLVASSSHRLAEGAADQASSLEETAASLEEMSAMTKSNAENVSQTSNMAESVRTSAETAQHSMERMLEVINKIKTSSDETATIVKTIDQIAFQTNLLALNAAVEAARAGEAGAGFAVVADEVRSLAMRSAESSRNTTTLIEESQKNADDGVKAAEEVKVILTEIVDGVKKVSALAQEIAVASDEQAHGVNQINQAVAQVDKVTQANASVSEETASASEELSGQARELNETVNHLARIVGIAVAEHKASSAGELKRPPMLDKGGRRPAAAPKKSAPLKQLAAKKAEPAAQKAAPAKKAAAPKDPAKAMKPDEIIPFDEDEFEDF
ncbi:MAG: methyl-accepting chemotaxis protein [Desulfobulbaceae bacterium]|nr:methyl-accepting chemotaxis protein [Desulfobulbaceae bacterium]